MSTAPDSGSVCDPYIIWSTENGWVRPYGWGYSAGLDDAERFSRDEALAFCRKYIPRSDAVGRMAMIPVRLADVDAFLAGAEVPDAVRSGTTPTPEYFRPTRIHRTAQIHHLAHTGEDVTIGARTRVWQFASVIRGAVIGEDGVVAGGVQIDGARLGRNCKVEAKAELGPGLLVGNDVFIGPFAMFCNDMWPEVSREGLDLDLLRSGEWAVIVEDGAMIGAHATVLPGVTIGARAVIAAGAVVDRSVPAGRLFRRNGAIDTARPAARMRFARPWAQQQSPQERKEPTP